MRHISAQNFNFQYSSTFVWWLIKELLHIISAHLVAGLGTEVLTQGGLALAVPALGLALPPGRHQPVIRERQLISTTINVNRINQSLKCAIKIIRVDTWNLNVSSFSFTSSTCWYDKVHKDRILYFSTLAIVILCLYLAVPGGDESGEGQGEGDPLCCHPPGHYVSVWISVSAPHPGKLPITLNLSMIFQISPDRDVTTLSVHQCLK